LRITNAWSIDQNSGKVSVNFFGDLRLNGNSIVDVKAITGMWGKWSIDENGKVVAKEVETEVLTVKENATFGSVERRIGITIYDEDTGEPYCLKMKGGAMKSEAGACGTTGNQESGIMNQGTSTTETQDIIVESGIMNNELGSETDSMASSTDSSDSPEVSSTPAVVDTTASTAESADSTTSTDSISSPQEATTTALAI
ncbi:MAG: hypothetical protein HYW90_01330, partial [Candidatus Sungbacteria bacterium]|nr:hypothetical protein [Candidatus Sungbacteria bacterium]